MVKLQFIYNESITIVDCKDSFIKLKELFKIWANKVGEEYKIIEKKNINGKVIEYYNFEFMIKKKLNPELTLSQIPHNSNIYVKKAKLPLIDEDSNNKNDVKEESNKLRNEIIEQIKTGDKNITFDNSLEHILKYGYLTEKQIEEEKKNNPENFIEIKDALKLKESNIELYILGKLAESLEKAGVKLVIDKRKSNNKENIVNNQFISSGLLFMSKYEFHINGKDIVKRDKIITDENEQKKFIKSWKKIFSKELTIPENEIIIANLREGSLVFDVVFKLDISNFNSKIQKLIKLRKEIIEIYQKNIMGACRLTPDMLDKRGNRIPDEWPKRKEKRGNLDYNPPDNNWVGYGLKVLEEYEDDDWIGMDGNPREWAVAYHGTKPKVVRPICLKNGKFFSTIEEGATGQKCQDEENINSLSKNEYKTCGEGAYCSPFLDYAENYAQLDKGGVIIMCRVNPVKIRMPKNYLKEYVTDGTKNSIRPYRILIKIDNEKNI